MSRVCLLSVCHDVHIYDVDAFMMSRRYARGVRKDPKQRSAKDAAEVRAAGDAMRAKSMIKSSKRDAPRDSVGR